METKQVLEQEEGESVLFQDFIEWALLYSSSKRKLYCLYLLSLNMSHPLSLSLFLSPVTHLQNPSDIFLITRVVRVCFSYIVQEQVFC